LLLKVRRNRIRCSEYRLAGELRRYTSCDGAVGGIRDHIIGTAIGPDSLIKDMWRRKAQAPGTDQHSKETE